MLEDAESIISEHISHLPSHVNALTHQLGPPPSLPAPECFMPSGQAHYFTVGSSVSGVSGINDPNYYVIDKTMMSQQSTLPHLQKASSKSSTTSGSTESQKYMIKNLIQQTNHSEFINIEIVLT